MKVARAPCSSSAHLLVQTVSLLFPAIQEQGPLSSVSQGAHLYMISNHSYNTSQQGEQVSLSLPPPPLGKTVSSVTQHHP